MDPNRDPRALESATCTDVAGDPEEHATDADDGRRGSIEAGFQASSSVISSSTHSERKRQRVPTSHRQAQETQADLRRERGRYEKRVAEMTRKLESERRELSEERRLASDERHRLLALRGRLKKRWHRSWAAERAAMQQRERAIEEATRRLEDQRQRFDRARRRAHTDLELQRRAFQEERGQHQREREAWESEREKEHAELLERARQLEQREAAVAATERALDDQKRQVESDRAYRERELQGLEQRILHQRRRLSDESRSGFSTSSFIAMPAADYRPVESEQQAADRDRLAAVVEKLTDQRRHLLEHWQRLIEVHQAWQREREQAFAELEEATQRVRERDEAIIQAEDRCRRLSEETNQRQRHVEAWKAQLTLRASAWLKDYKLRHAELEARQESLKKQRASLDEARRAYLERHRRGLDRLRDLYATSERLCREYTLSRDQWRKRAEAIVDGEKKLAERAVVVEQFCRQRLGPIADDGASDQRLAKCQTRLARLHRRAANLVQREREALADEAKRLEERHHEVFQTLRQIQESEADLAQREAACDIKQGEQESRRLQLDEHARMTVSRQTAHEQHIGDLRDEIERLVCGMLADDGRSIPRAA